MQNNFNIEKYIFIDNIQDLYQIKASTLTSWEMRFSDKNQVNENSIYIIAEVDKNIKYMPFTKKDLKPIKKIYKLIRIYFNANYANFICNKNDNKDKILIKINNSQLITNCVMAELCINQNSFINFVISKKKLLFENFDEVYNLELKPFNNSNENQKIKAKIYNNMFPMNMNMNANNQNQIYELQKELKEERDKNKILQDTINQLNNTIIQLQQKNNTDIEKYNTEIKSYIDKIELMNNNIQKLSSENNSLKNKIKSNNSQNNSEEIISLYKRNEELNKRVDDLNEKLKRYPFILEKDEKILSIIFACSSFHYSIICKNTDTIHKLETELYKKYPEFSETNNYFLCKGDVAKKFKTLEELKLKNGDIIIIKQQEDEY